MGNLKRVDPINSRIQTLVSESNMSYKQLAEEIGVHPHYICCWATDRNTPSLKNMMAICRHFNVSADWLCGLSDERTLLRKDPTLEEALDILKRIDAKLDAAAPKKSARNYYVMRGPNEKTQKDI